MNKLQEMIAEQISDVKAFEIESARLDKRLKALKEKRESLHRPYHMDFIKRLAPLLLADMPNRTVDILGPFGLCCEVSIHFIRKNSKKPYEKRGGVKSLTFVDAGDNGVPAVRDYRKSTGRYAPNTIGEMNGMNYKVIPIPADADLQWFRKFIR